MQRTSLMFIAIAAFAPGCAMSDSPEELSAASGDRLSETGDEIVVASSDTYLKTSVRDSTEIGPSEKCKVPHGTQVRISQARVDGNHVSGLIQTALGCGGAFSGGSPIFAFRDHFSGWSKAISEPLRIEDDPDNYAASCQHAPDPRDASEIRRIVLHNTEGRWESFKSEWQSCRRIGAAHFVILRSGKVLRTIPERLIAYHAIGANADSLGIEIESGPGFAGMTSSQEASVVALTTRLRVAYSVPAKAVTMHRLASPGTTDCASYVWPHDKEFISWRDRTFR